jgi:hypothetical protein
MNNYNISKKYTSLNKKILNQFNTFLLSDKFISKKMELEKSEFSNNLTIREFTSKNMKRKYVRRLLNDSNKKIYMLSDILNLGKKIKKDELDDNSILITNYIEDIHNNNFIEENILYTNFNLENYTGEDVESKTHFIKSYHRDLKEAREYKVYKNKCNEDYFDCEFKMLNLLGKSSNKNVLFGDHIKEIWKNNKSSNELNGFIKYILKLIESIDYFSKSDTTTDYNILNKGIHRTIDVDKEIMTILGNNNLSFGIYKTKNKYSNTTLEKYNEILIIFCSFLIILDRFEYDPTSQVKNDNLSVEKKIRNKLNNLINKMNIISKTNIYLHKNNIFDYKIYFIFLYVKEVINNKHYCRGINHNILKNKIDKYIKVITLYNHGDIENCKSNNILSDYFSIVNLYELYNKFLNKELFFENTSIP